MARRWAKLGFPDQPGEQVRMGAYQVEQDRRPPEPGARPSAVR